MPPERRRNNHIDERQAEKFGSFLDMARQEIEDVNRHAREKALAEGAGEYYRCGTAHIQYTMGIKIGHETEGTDRRREAEVVMNTDLEKVSNPNVDQAPFNVLAGVISPAEKNRSAVLKVVDDIESSAIVPLSRSVPIFHLGADKFWIVDPDTMAHRVVELDSQSVTYVTNMNDLNRLTRRMYSFLATQLSQTYGE